MRTRPTRFEIQLIMNDVIVDYVKGVSIRTSRAVRKWRKTIRTQPGMRVRLVRLTDQGNITIEKIMGEF